MIRNEFEVFKRLNEKLKENNLTLTVIAVGGFVLSHYGIRMTQDVDGFYDESEALASIIREVGNEFGINSPYELWLKNSVENVNVRPVEDICDPLYTFSNLLVLMPPLEYIAAMKLCSGRKQDIEDVASIIRLRNIESPKELKERTIAFNLGPIDISLLFEAFSAAYGLEWLEKYYLEHEDEIIEDYV